MVCVHYGVTRPPKQVKATKQPSLLTGDPDIDDFVQPNPHRKKRKVSATVTSTAATTPPPQCESMGTLENFVPETPPAIQQPSQLQFQQVPESPDSDLQSPVSSQETSSEPRLRPFLDKLKVDADCTGTVTYQSEAHFKGNIRSVFMA